MPRGKKATSSAGFGEVVASLQVARGRLMAQRSALDAQLSAVDAALRAMGTTVASAVASAPAAAGGKKRGRPPGPGRNLGPSGLRAGSLKDVIFRVLSDNGGIMAVGDVANGVVKAGYKTRNQTLAKSVGIALTQIPGVVKVSRGRFKVK